MPWYTYYIVYSIYRNGDYIEHTEMVSTPPANDRSWLSRFNRNPELHELDRLPCNHGGGGEGGGALSLPSFEAFFGQSGEVLYYSPQIKMFFAPFLARCVGSFENWERFFTSLFMGGTVREAKQLLNLASDCAGCMHVRSPIHSIWNPDTHSLDSCRRRERAEAEDMSHLILPVNCYLTGRPLGRDTNPPPRTWSSELFHHVRSAAAQIADAVKAYILSAIHSHASDPKGKDDPEGGGEWFLAWLRAVHRVCVRVSE